MRTIHAAGAVLTLSILLIAATATAEVYRNAEFGITVPITDGLLCHPAREDEHDHGPVILLDHPADVKGCRDLERSRHIGVFASYNAADETKTLSKLLKWNCTKTTAKGRCRPAPSGLRIRGMPTAAARLNRSDGWIDVIVVTQAGAPDPAFDASVPSVNFELTLHTTPDHLKQDLRTLRTMLRAIRLSPPH